MSLYPLQRFESNDTLFSCNLNSKTELLNESRNHDNKHFTLQLIPNANANSKEIDNNNIEIINDLTGNTIIDGSTVTTTASNQLERRLSISDYRTENGNYYEYEFLVSRNLTSHYLITTSWKMTKMTSTGITTTVIF